MNNTILFSTSRTKKGEKVSKRTFQHCQFYHSTIAAKKCLEKDEKLDNDENEIEDENEEEELFMVEKNKANDETGDISAKAGDFLGVS